MFWNYRAKAKCWLNMLSTCNDLFSQIYSQTTAEIHMQQNKRLFKRRVAVPCKGGRFKWNKESPRVGLDVSMD